MLKHILAEAVALGGGNLCAAGHDWQSIGGRYCERCDGRASQPVFQCARCGQYDYGEPGGPGYAHCDPDVPCRASTC